MINIFKFGGSCFKTEDSFKKSLRIVENYNSDSLIIVCSAMYGITNKLISYGRAREKHNEQEAKTIYTDIKDIHINTINYLFKKKEELKTEITEKITSILNEFKSVGDRIANETMTDKNYANLVTFGEYLSSVLFCFYLKYKNYESEYITTEKNFIITDDDYRNAFPLLNDQCVEHINGKIAPLLKEDKIVVITGFYGSNQYGEITTLGRGGTDFTTTIVAWALSKKLNVPITQENAKDVNTPIKCIFWKDVYGFLATNPKYIPEAKLLHTLTISEAKELAHFGSKILHPTCLNTVEIGNDITVDIKNFDDPFCNDYTKLVPVDVESLNRPSYKVIRAITSIEDVAMITVESEAMSELPAMVSKLFSVISKKRISLLFITQGSSKNNITFGVNESDAETTIALLKDKIHYGSEWFDVKVEKDMSLLAVVGAGMVHKPGIAGLLFTTLGNVGVNIRAIAQGSSEINITMLIARDGLNRAVKSCYKAFIMGNLPEKILNW